MSAGRILLATLLLAGCTPPRDEAGPASRPVPADPPPPATSAPPALASLAGEWRVAAIDDRSLDEPVGLALSASDAEIWWDPRCAGMARSYRIAGNAFAAGPPLGTVPRKPGDATPPVCAIGLPPRLGEAFAAIDAARHIARTPANGVRLSGGGRSLLLFGQ